MIDELQILPGLEQIAFAEEVVETFGGFKAAAEMDGRPEEAVLRDFDGGGVVFIGLGVLLSVSSSAMAGRSSSAMALRKASLVI